MTLKRIFFHLFGGLVFSSVVLAVVTMFASARTHEHSSEITLMFEKVRLSEELQIHLLNTNRTWFLHALTGEAEYQRERYQAEREVRATLQQLDRLVQSQSEAKILKEVSDTAQAYLDTLLTARNRGLAAPQAYQNVNPSLRRAHQKASALNRYNLDRATHAAERSRAGADFVAMVAAAVLMLCFLLLPLAWHTIRKWIYLPIQNLRRAIAAFGENTQPDLVRPEGTREIQEVGEAFNELASRLSDQRKARLRFLAGVAHDIKNPLSGIKMSTEVLASDDWPREKRREMLAIISRQTDQLNRMIGDFLDASRIESGHLELLRNRENLHTIVHDAVMLHRQVSHRHQITFHSAPRRLECDCDAARISQVVNNLLSNAIKYSPDGGEIRVSLSTRGPLAVLRISDEGIGIPEKDIPRVFEPFRRTRLTRETIPGVGLGLSVSRHIIEGHGGNIKLESQVGVGSTVTVLLPRLPEAPSRADVRSPIAAAPAG